MISEYITKNLKETIDLGRTFALTLDKGCVIALHGDLGVGKTAFTKGIAKGLGINDTVTSPTFTLLREYEGRLNLKHIDAYRLEHSSADSLALFDLIDEDAVVVIEWSEFVQDFVDYDYIVTLTEIDENTRMIRIEDMK